MIMKKMYVKPNAEWILLEETDILTASDDLDDLYPNEPDDGHTKRY